MRVSLLVALAWLSSAAAGDLGCAGPAPTRPAAPPTAPPAQGDDGAGASDHQATAGSATTGRVTLSVVGLNDLHGHVERLPWIGGYVANLRRARAADGGAVLVVDAGDLFQGTLASNTDEGAAVVVGYEALGVAAAAIGNHEFDFGPVGPDAVVTRAGQDPRGALLARAAEADFPLLAANLLDRATGARVDWPGVAPSALVTVAGVKVGLVGVTTEATLATTLRANVTDLRMAPLADAIAAEARALRGRGAAVVVALAHAGGDCDDFDDPAALGSCDAGSELFRVARALPEGSVDLLVGGHTHQGVAHRVAGVPVIESFAYGTAFGRVDLVVDRGAGGVVDARIFPPRRVCAGDDRRRDVDPARCRPGDYEGAPVTPDPAVEAAIAPFVARAREVEARDLGVELTGTFRQRYRDETALGNLLTDLMRAARPGAYVALQNGGGIRDDLPRGRLRYGDFYRAFPFDNRFAFLSLRGEDLADMIARNLNGRGGFLSVSGVTAKATCRGDRVVGVTLRRPDGAPIPDDARLRVVTNEYVATSGDAVVRRLPDDAVTIEDGPPLREALVDALRARGGRLAPADFFDAERPRVQGCARRGR